jgi:hypothetical protein
MAFQPVIDRLRVERAKLVTEIKRVDSAIAALLPAGKAVGAPGRKPMSDEAKRNIAEGLKKARDTKAREARGALRKLASKKQGAPTAPAVQAPTT